MAKYNDVLEILREYRNELEQQTQQEVESQFSETDGMMTSFAARGGVSAFATPLSNVHATGVGIRMKQGKVVENEFVIKVYVFDKFQLGESTPELTKQYKDVDIDVEPLPIQHALLKQTPKKSTKKSTNITIKDHRSRKRPIVGGVSIAPINEAFVGTLGCFLQRSSNGVKQVFALSNNHVLEDTNRLPIGTLIVQPGPEVEPSKPGDVFAALSSFIPLQFSNGRLDPVVNVLDAAIAIVADERLIKKGSILGIKNYNPQLGVAVPGMRVIKSGRTTGVTTGIVTATRVNGVQINYGTRTSLRIATFNDTIQIVSEVEGKPFSLPGDSGSVIVDQATGKPVALLFAGDGRTTTACDIGGICKQFQAFPI
jgi:hypothetical protein